MDTVDARAFGQLEGTVKSMGELILTQGKLLENLTREVNEVTRTLAQARGGWKTLLVIGGAAASASGLITYILQHISFAVTR